MCLWAEDVDIPVDIARQAVLYVHAKLDSQPAFFNRLHLLIQAAAGAHGHGSQSSHW